MDLRDYIAINNNFDCGKERVYNETKCNLQCSDCVLEYKNNLINNNMKTEEKLQAISCLTDVVKANNTIFGCGKTMEIANKKIEELMINL